MYGEPILTFNRGITASDIADSGQWKFEAQGNYSASARFPSSRRSTTVYISTSLTSGAISSHELVYHAGLDMSVSLSKFLIRVPLGLDASNCLYKYLSLAFFITIGWLSAETSMKQSSARNQVLVFPDNRHR